MSGAPLALSRLFRYFCEASSAFVPPSIGLRGAENLETKKSLLVGPTEPAGGGSPSQVAMALAGVGLALPSRLALREGSGPEHPSWITLDERLDAGGASHHQMA